MSLWVRPMSETETFFSSFKNKRKLSLLISFQNCHEALASAGADDGIERCAGCHTNARRMAPNCADCNAASCSVLAVNLAPIIAWTYPNQRTGGQHPIPDRYTKG
jgi:hypothetical protein